MNDYIKSTPDGDYITGPTYDDGLAEGYENGYLDGKHDGYDEGYDNGYDDGWDEAERGHSFGENS